MVTELQAITVKSAPSAPWAEGLTMRPPKSLLNTPGFTIEGGALCVAQDAQVPPSFVEESRFRAAFTVARPTSSRLPISYQWVPAIARTIVRHSIGRLQLGNIHKWAAYPGYPLDLTTDFLADLSERPKRDATQKTPVLLSHDIDSLEGLKNAVRMFVDIEESVGARSSNYIVPCAWPVDHGLIGELQRRGHEIGIHGYNHSNRTPYVSEQERTARLMAAKPLVDHYGIVGYRAPSLCRTKPLFQGLKKIYRYDSSIPTSGGLFPVPNNGCASARPFYVESLAELPLSMPRDGSLRSLGYSPGKIVAIWRECLEQIHRSGGIAVLLTHCESGFSGNKPMLAAYREFLEWVAADGRFAWQLPIQALRERLAGFTDQ